MKENVNLDTHITGGFGTNSDLPQLHRLLRKLHLNWKYQREANVVESGLEFPQNVNLRKC